MLSTTNGHNGGGKQSICSVFFWGVVWCQSQHFTVSSLSTGQLRPKSFLTMGKGMAAASSTINNSACHDAKSLALRYIHWFAKGQRHCHTVRIIGTSWYIFSKTVLIRPGPGAASPTDWCTEPSADGPPFKLPNRFCNSWQLCILKIP